MADRPPQRRHDPAEESGWGSPMPAEYGSLATFLPPLDDSPAPPASSKGDAEPKNAERPAAARGGERSGDPAAAPRPGEQGGAATPASGRPERRRWFRKAAPAGEGPEPSTNGVSADRDGVPVWAPPAAAGRGGCGRERGCGRRWQGGRFGGADPLGCPGSPGRSWRGPPDTGSGPGRGCRWQWQDGWRRGRRTCVRRHHGGPGEPGRGRQRHSAGRGWRQRRVPAGR